MPVIVQLLTALLLLCLSVTAQAEKLRIVTEPWAPYVYEENGKKLGLDYETTAIVFKRLGIEDQLKPKATMVPKIPVGSVVAKGDYQVGMQQVSELLPVPGVSFVGKLPEAVQSVTRFAAGIPVGAQHPGQAKALLDYLASPGAQQDVQATGLDSVRR